MALALITSFGEEGVAVLLPASGSARQAIDSLTQSICSLVASCLGALLWQRCSLQCLHCALAAQIQLCGVVHA